MALPRNQRPEIYVKHISQRFRITSDEGASRLCLTNTVPILLRSGVPNLVSLGLKIVTPREYAFLLTAQTIKKVVCHTGLIDTGYQGELKLLIVNTKEYNATLYPHDLLVYLVAFNYHTPHVDQRFLTPPQYQGDAGYDLRCPGHMLWYPGETGSFTRLEPRPAQGRQYVPVILGRSGLACKGLLACPRKWKSHRFTAKLTNYSKETLELSRGDRMCQVVFMDRQHLPSRRKLTLAHTMKIGKLRFCWANVSFMDTDTDLVENLAPLSTEPHTSHHGRTRGDAGFGSSGL